MKLAAAIAAAYQKHGYKHPTLLVQKEISKTRRESSQERAV